MKILARLLVLCIIAALITGFVYAFDVIDTAAKNTASYLKDQTAFAYYENRLVILNNEIPLP